MQKLTISDCINLTALSDAIGEQKKEFSNFGAYCDLPPPVPRETLLLICILLFHGNGGRGESG
jgi:hypothetical protein